MAGVRKKPYASGYYQGWYISYLDERKYFVGTQDYDETLQAALDKESEHNLIRVGTLPKPKSASKPQPLATVIKEYLAWGGDKGGHGGLPWAPDHAGHRKTHLEFWAERLGAIAIQDVTLARIDAILRDLKKNGRIPKNRKKPVPMSGKSLNAYAEAIKAMCEWAIDRNYLYENPLARLTKFNETPQIERRALTEEELQLVLDNAVRPEDRILFEVACLTGYRRGELKALRVKDLDVEGCTLPLAGEFCKNRKAARQSVPRALLARLVESAEGKKPDAPLLMVNDKPHERLYLAMDRAGIPYKGDGWRIDLHSLRSVYATMAFDSGANMREAQTMMRHSTPILTMRYAKTRDKRKQELAEIMGGKVLKPRAGSVLKDKKEESGMLAKEPAASVCGDSELVSPRGFEPRSSG